MGPGCNGWFEAHERFLMFIHPFQWNLKGKHPRPSAGQFRKEEQSSDWNALKAPEQIRAEKPGYGVVALSVRQCVERGQRIRYSPTVDGSGILVNPAHSDIIGDKGTWPADSLKTARWFSRQCVVLILPE